MSHRRIWVNGGALANVTGLVPPSFVMSRGDCGPAFVQEAGSSAHTAGEVVKITKAELHSTTNAASGVNVSIRRINDVLLGSVCCNLADAFTNSTHVAQSGANEISLEASIRIEAVTGLSGPKCRVATLAELRRVLSRWHTRCAQATSSAAAVWLDMAVGEGLEKVVECRVMCRFLGRRDVGLSTHADGRRRRSAKARSRGRWGVAVQLALWGLRPGAGIEG
jgi:hypothetical protein